MEGKIDRADHEGQFGKPEFFARDGVKNRMDEKFPHHPLMRSEARFERTFFIPLVIVVQLQGKLGAGRAEHVEEDHGAVHAT